MRERVKRLFLRVKYSSTKDKKWSGKKWEFIGSHISAIHSGLFIASLIKTIYNIKYTYKCDEFDYRYACYIGIMNIMSLWPIPEGDKDKPKWITDMENKLQEMKAVNRQGQNPGNQNEDNQNDENQNDANQDDANQNDEHQNGQEERQVDDVLEKKKNEAFPNSDNSQIAATIVVGITIVCYYFNLLSVNDLVLFLATHLFASATKIIYFLYTEYCKDERKKPIEQKFPDLASMKPIRMRWYRAGYALRACLIISTILAFTSMPSLDDKCPVFPAPTFISYAYLLCIFFIVLGEHWDENCKWCSLYNNVLNERQYIFVGKNASLVALHNYIVNMGLALLFLSVSAILFYFDQMTLVDLAWTLIGGGLWILLYTVSGLCFIRFVGQAVEDYEKTGQALVAEEGLGEGGLDDEGKADDVQDEPENKSDDGGIPV